MKLRTLVICLAFTFLPACASNHAEISQQEQIVSDKKVEIFVTDWCPFCQRLEKFLKSKNIPYTRHNIDTDPEAKKTHKKISGGGGIPVTRVGETIIRGYDPEEILNALKQ